jgi:type VI secretion system protein ImpA
LRARQQGIIVFDPESLAQAVDSQPPCGPDCEYEGDFLALSQAVAGKPEQQFGDTVIAAVEPDWRSVEQLALDLFTRTKDLRVAAWLTLAATHLHGIHGFASGVGLMNSLCQQYWDEVHPRMVIDGDDDPYLRMNALGALSDGSGGYADGSEIMRALRAAVLVSRGLPLTVRDIEMTALKDSAANYAETQVLSIVSDALADGAESVALFEQAAQSIADLAALVEDKVATSDQPDFSALKALLKAVTGLIGRARSAAGGGDSAEESSDAAGDTGGSGPRGDSVPGELRSREDVRRALERICDYLERYEPSSPASLFARRAERMLGKGFLDIMLELSPDSMQHLEMLTGAKAPENSE